MDLLFGRSSLYDPTKKLKLTCDSSCYGVGAVLSHVINGEEKPISLASKTLSSAEKNYAQIKREALVDVFGLKKYLNHLFGRRFELVTDHSPLTIIFGEKKNRDYQILYKKEADIPTEKDVVLKQVFVYVRDGWPSALARSFVWWPTLDNQIEDQVKQRSSCQSQSNSGRVTPVYWPLTHRRWQQVHMDLAQIYYKGAAVNIFILTGAYSKWIEAIVMGTVTTSDIITEVRSLVAAYGLMEEVVSDNGPQFCSQLIKKIFEKNVIKHTLTPSYRANSNGAAERAVQNIKAAIKRSLQDQPFSFQNLQHIKDNYLMVFRNTPHTVTGRTPAEMFLGRRPRTRLSILQPNLSEHVEKKRAATTPALIRVKTYDEGEKVWVRNVRREEVKWFPGVVTKTKSLSTCLVRVNGVTKFVHVDYLKPKSTSELPQMGTNSNPAVNINPSRPQGSVVQSEDKTISDVQSEPPPQRNMQTTTSDVQPSPLPLTYSEPTQEPLKRSTRVKRRPLKYS
ncbi:hypothetical protein ILUMI_07463 [Ignelater luminosus]|uniref:Integrase catalytic domain-containing protein n=1 Tax=Ignelater luminosus TaxID=2038154 RepID=A0A8K0GBL1_IGNLU|nr:hypothetical protein ILUMI_07463 [Ignelater luminosus]